ncbi:4-phosphopantoate--beta-alanine ligase [Candidatus Methanoperedenaceae archaeon GB50]|nr:4-phosphopantoate--beta-alanine ligase [Candidatus Methanoperedenaceae archaeon GB50]CAD7774303.1 MAG: 4-phosphopantoate--beta-alanine ligase [Candidatus Methanoperedenaceae archaeon GB50]
MDLPESHPRYQSLLLRERVAMGVEMGITSLIGLIAHGRGEAFDYLLGERTIPSARRAEAVGVAALLLADHPVISVNGNAVALAADDLIALGDALGAGIEVNIFYHSEERRERIIRYLEKRGAGELYVGSDARIPGLAHNRGVVDSHGIYAADTVLVPLEDGDRCSALKRMGKTVVAIDLNPLSRTARTADVTIVDNIVRAVPEMRSLVEEVASKGRSELQEMLEDYDNMRALADALDEITRHLSESL